MNSRQLLVRLFFEEHSEEGLNMLRKMCTVAKGADLTIYARNSRVRQHREQFISATPQFNIVEGEVYIDGGIRIRYRPAVSSAVWADIVFEMPSHVTSSEQHELVQLFLTLLKFQHPTIDQSSKSSAVFEFLCPVENVGDRIEETISAYVARFCPDLLAAAWGYADIVPFRQLSLEEEWSIARTDLLWLDVSVTEGAEHQYLFCSSEAQPPVRHPDKPAYKSTLSIFKLPSMR
jgi:hypothetical protein